MAEALPTRPGELPPGRDVGEADGALRRRRVRPGPRRAPTTRRVDVYVAVASGGALGGPARYGMGLLLPGGGWAFPWATFAVNVSGCFLLGTLLVLLAERFPPSRHARPFLGTGFLGAYTTFSMFAVETDLLVRAGRIGLAAAYALGSTLASLLAAWLGVAVGHVGADERRT